MSTTTDTQELEVEQEYLLKEIAILQRRREEIAKRLKTRNP